MEGIRRLVAQPCNGVDRKTDLLNLIEKLRVIKGDSLHPFGDGGQQQTLSMRVQITQSNLLELFLLSVYQLGDVFLPLRQCLTFPIGIVVDVNTVSHGCVE